MNYVDVRVFIPEERIVEFYMHFSEWLVSSPSRCSYCKSTFPQTRRSKMYCSSSCKTKAARKRRQKG